MRHWWSMLLAMVVLCSCAQIPTSGPVNEVRQKAGDNPRPFEIRPEPPRDDYSLRQLIQGFLYAMTDAAGDYGVARQYLTGQARERWDPSDGVLVYAEGDAPVISESSASIETTIVGRVGERGVFQKTQDLYTLNFGVVQENGRWRIGNPPAGILLRRDQFSIAFAAMNLYFFVPGSDRVLVPDRLFVPKGRLTPVFILRELVQGPSPWLKPAVVNTAPTNMPVIEASLEGGERLDIELGPEAHTLEQATTEQFLAQVSMSLARSEQDNVARIRLLVAGRPLDLLGGASDGSVPVERFASYLPTRMTVDNRLYGVWDGKVAALPDSESSGARAPVPIEGPLGAGGTDIDSIALSPDLTAAAAVIDRGRSLVRVRVNDNAAKLRPLVRDQRLLTPQFTRFDELWAMSGPPGRQTVHMVNADGLVRSIAAPDLDGIAVRSWRIAPDGVRMAVAGTKGGKPVVGMLRIERSNGLVIRGWRRLVLTSGSSGPAEVLSLSWRGESDILALGSAAGSNAVNPWQFDTDALEVELLATVGWNATEIATAPYGGEVRAAARGGEQVWHYRDNRNWPKLVKGVTAIAYPG